MNHTRAAVKVEEVFLNLYREYGNRTFVNPSIVIYTTNKTDASLEVTNNAPDIHTSMLQHELGNIHQNKYQWMQ